MHIFSVYFIIGSVFSSSRNLTPPSESLFLSYTVNSRCTRAANKTVEHFVTAFTFCTYNWIFFSWTLHGKKSFLSDAINIMSTVFFFYFHNSTQLCCFFSNHFILLYTLNSIGQGKVGYQVSCPWFPLQFYL